MKKRIIALILSVLMIMTITACKKANNTDMPEIGTQTEKNEEIKTIQVVAGEGYKEESADNGYATIIKASYPVVMTYYEDENKFPGLKKALEDSNKSTKDYQLKFIDQNLEFAKEFYDEDDEYYQPLETSVTPSVRRADTLVTSILYYGYEYNGGMHGESYYYGENYDTKTGKELKLTDVVNDKEKLAEAIREQLDVFHRDTITDSDVNLDEVLEDEDFYSWTLDYNGITFYFMPYAINSSSGYMVAVTLENEEYSDILKKEYKEVPKSYGVELTPDVPFYYDVTGDGIIDEIRAGGYESNFGDAGCIDLTVNGVSHTEEDWFYGYNAAFVHLPDGRNYIYYELLRENDYRETVCFDVKYGVKNIGSVDGGLRRIYRSDDDFTTLQDALTNPENFTFQQTTQHLSTVTGYKEYFVGDEGVPVSNDKMFALNEKKLTFTLLQDIEVDIYDEKQGTVIGKKTLRIDEEVIYYATDGEKYALLKCSDGTLCRVECVFDNEEYYNKVNGIKLEELFDGIIFAG